MRLANILICSSLNSMFTVVLSTAIVNYNRSKQSQEPIDSSIHCESPGED